MKRWIHASTEENIIEDPFHTGDSLRGLSKEELEREYADYVDKNAYPTFDQWMEYMVKEGNVYTSADGLSGSKLAEAIEKLLDVEKIPYDYVDSINDDDDDEIFIIVKTYGDWRNDNDRAHELIVNKFHPDSDYSEEADDDLKDYRLSPGSDSCVVRHEFIWYS